MSTAKSMANSYLSAKRIQSSQVAQARTLASQRFKSSTSNLTNRNLQPSSNSTSNTRLKSTSMTNLMTPEQQQQQQQRNQQNTSPTSKIQRPASRNALDSIHNGMNAKYAQVQSKVYLQNIRPPAGSNSSSSKIPASQKSATLDKRSTGGRTTPGGGQVKVPNDRSALMIKVKALEEEIERGEQERDNLKAELEREKGDKIEQISQLKQELQEKLAEHDKQNEEYHQKLLEAYELADQNRKAADSVLSESRQRDEDSRKKVEELEGQLNELKEFVTMKEEMTGKMYELREQIREERQRYEDQLKSLHQVFENEKISHHQSGELSSANKLDQKSNYFNRIKPSLQSNESINKCRKCASGSSQLHHRSEHDMYGSKLSTRMQDSAKSAWKASKHFASSVITGGVGLSSCRQCTSKRGTLSANKQQQQQQQQQQQPVGEGISLGNQQQRNKHRDELVLQAENSARFSKCSPSSMNNFEYNNNHMLSKKIEANNCEADVSYDDDQHTSVIEVGPTKSATTTSENSNLQHNHSQQQQVAVQQQLQTRQDESVGLIRVDENNKLTIVTKFNDSDCSTGPNTSIEIGAPTSSGSGSERSRCESSSSGRGTSSDAGSSASQNGDLDVNDKPNNVVKQKNDDKDSTNAQGNKRHKRKSSLFKAGKLFGGSQASLNKLRNFFTGSSSSVIKVTSKEELKQRHPDNEHLERSRLRCMELNHASAKVNVKSSEQSIVETSDANKSVSEASSNIVDQSQNKLYRSRSRSSSNNNNNNNNNISDSQEIKIKAVSSELGQGGCQDQVEVDQRREEGDSSFDFKAGQKQEQQQEVANGGVLIVGS